MVCVSISGGAGSARIASHLPKRTSVRCGSVRKSSTGGKIATLSAEIAASRLNLARFLADPAAVEAFLTLVSYTIGGVGFQAAWERLPESDEEELDPDLEERLRQSRLRFESARRSAYPSVVELAPQLAEAMASFPFEQGLDRILEMIEGRMSEDEAVAMIVTRTRQFAVRQERWFRRDPRVRWIDVEHDVVAEAAPIVIDALTA